MSKPNVLLVGAGEMAHEYFKVLEGLKCEFTVVTRSARSAKYFEKLTCKKVELLKDFDLKSENFTHAINAVSVGSLREINSYLFASGIKKILSEKPAGKNVDEIAALTSEKPRGVDLYVGYNRRFYSSVQFLLKKLAESDDIRSVNFDFSELFWKIDPTLVDEITINNWFFANSTHIIDLVFYIIGRPKWLNGAAYEFPSGNSIFPGPDVFHGFGVSERGIPFSYQADFHGANRWSIDVKTSQSTFTLCPLEDLYSVDVGALERKLIFSRSKMDRDFKPGLFGQVEAFLSDCVGLLSIEAHLQSCLFYKQIHRG